MVFVIALIMAALITPFIRYNQEKMGKAMCANNLRQIGLTLYIYAKEHNGNFPPALKTLYDEHYLADRRIMDCPASDATGTPESPDYMYTAGLSVRDPSLAPIARDKATNHPKGGGNALHVNGEVTWERGTGEDN